MKQPIQPAPWGNMAGIFTLGAAVGSVMALLYAPASGKATRKKIGLKFKSVQRATAQQVLRTKKLLTQKAGILGNVAVEKLDGTREWLARIGTNHSAPRRVAHRA